MSEHKIMKVSDLKPHPKNEEIYGHNEEISDLVEKIKRSGQVHTLVVTPKGVVLAGHRRLRACKELGIEEVDVEVVDFDTLEQEVEYLIDNNATREKSEVQRAREAQELKKVEMILAKKRQSDNGGDKKSKKYKSDVPKLAHANYAETKKGKARDKVAKTLGYKSGQEADRAISTLNKIDELSKEGHDEEAKLITDVMNNRGISAAHSLAKNIDNIRFSEKEKEDVRRGNKSPNAFIRRNGDRKEQKPEEKFAESSDKLKGLDYTLSAIQKRYHDYLLMFQEDIKWLSDKEFYREDGEEVTGKTHSELQNCLEKFKGISNLIEKMIIDEFGCITIRK